MQFNILSVDEFGMTKIELSNMLKNIDVQIVDVKDEIEMAKVLHEKKIQFNIISWTVNSIDLKDFEAVKRLKSKNSPYKSIPVIVVSKLTDKKYIMKAIECGAAEYIAKPYDEEFVSRKICKILGIDFVKASAQKIDEDIVTYNFSEMLNKEIKAASRGMYPITIAMAGLVEDAARQSSTSNLEGMTSLTKRVIKTKLRETDTSFQYGPNTLAILLPFTDKAGSKTVEEKLKDIFATHSMIKQRNTGYDLVVASVTFPDDGKIKGKLMGELEQRFNAAIGHFTNPENTKEY